MTLPKPDMSEARRINGQLVVFVADGDPVLYLPSTKDVTLNVVGERLHSTGECTGRGHIMAVPRRRG